MMKTITITVTDEQATRLDTLRKTTMAGEVAPVAKTLEQVMYSVVERGLYTIEYNRKQYIVKKTSMKVWKEVQKNPEMMIRLGLAHAGDGNEGIRTIPDGE